MGACHAKCDAQKVKDYKKGESIKDSKKSDELEAASKKAFLACTAKCDEHDGDDKDPCDKVCPKGCDSPADAKKAKCKECAKCHGMMAEKKEKENLEKSGEARGEGCCQDHEDGEKGGQACRP